MGFRTDRMTAQDRILNKFSRVLKEEANAEKERLSLKNQLKQLEQKEHVPVKKKEEEVRFVPIFAVKNKIDSKK